MLHLRGICSFMRSLPSSDHASPDDEDVLQEEEIVKQQHRKGVVDPNLVVQIHGLVKVYRVRTYIGFCSFKRTPPYHALKGLWENAFRFTSVKLESKSVTLVGNSIVSNTV